MDKVIYFDHAATTPTKKAVLDEMFFIETEMKEYILKEVKQVFLINEKLILLVATSPRNEYISLVKEFDQKTKNLIERLIQGRYILLKEDLGELKIYKTTLKWKESDLL